MDARRSEPNPRYGSSLPDPERTISKNASRSDDCPIMAHVMKALAYCRRYTRLYSSKSRSNDRGDIGLGSLSSTTTNLSRNPKHRRRPTLLKFGQGQSSSIQSYGASYYDDSDPFITSPSWLKDEYFGEETNVYTLRGGNIVAPEVWEDERSVFTYDSTSIIGRASAHSAILPYGLLHRNQSLFRPTELALRLRRIARARACWWLRCLVDATRDSRYDRIKSHTLNIKKYPVKESAAILGYVQLEANFDLKFKKIDSDDVSALAMVGMAKTQVQRPTGAAFVCEKVSDCFVSAIKLRKYQSAQYEPTNADGIVAYIHAHEEGEQESTRNRLGGWYLC